MPPANLLLTLCSPSVIQVWIFSGLIYTSSTVSCLKCLGREIFYLIRKSFQNEWCLFYCDSALGCQVVQDFDLCKLDDLWCHFVYTKWCKITKNWISHNFFCIELKLGAVVTLITKFHDMSTVAFPWQHNGAQAPSIQRGKSQVSSFKKC